jgi:prolipoprotein diacylglyceryltransferase
MMIAYAIGRIGCQVAGDGDWGILNSAYVTNAEGKAMVASPADYNAAIQKNFTFYQSSLRGVTQVQTPADIPNASFAAPRWLPDWTVAYPFTHNVINEGIKLNGCEERYCSTLPVPVYPTPFYETVICFILFFVLWVLRKKIKPYGALFALYLILNGLERFFIEKIRVNNQLELFGLHPTQAEIISLGLVITGIALWAFLSRRYGIKTVKA